MLCSMYDFIQSKQADKGCPLSWAVEKADIENICL